MSIHVDLEILDCVIGGFALSPMGTRIREQPGAFERNEDQMHSGSVRDDVCGSGLSGKLLNISNAGVQLIDYDCLPRFLASVTMS